MRYRIFGLLLVLGAIVAISSVAWAKCPAGTRYVCEQGWNGKVICACR